MTWRLSQMIIIGWCRNISVAFKHQTCASVNHDGHLLVVTLSKSQRYINLKRSINTLVSSCNANDNVNKNVGSLKLNFNKHFNLNNSSANLLFNMISLFYLDYNSHNWLSILFEIKKWHSSSFTSSQLLAKLPFAH